MLYPGWECLFLVDEDGASASTVADIRRNGGTVAPFPALPVSLNEDGSVQRTRLGRTLSRLLIALDGTVARLLVRDVDSRLNGRERLAVEEWLRSDRSLHVLRDHPGHCRTPALTGLLGLRLSPDMRSQLLRGLQAWSSRYPEHSRFQATEVRGNDDEFLASFFWPQLQQHALSYMAHDSYCCEAFRDKLDGRADRNSSSTRPFPSERIDYEHCGQVSSSGGEEQEDAVSSAQVAELEVRVAPMSCRGHPDWDYG